MGTEGFLLEVGTEGLMLEVGTELRFVAGGGDGRFVAGGGDGRFGYRCTEKNNWLLSMHSRDSLYGTIVQCSKC